MKPEDVTYAAMKMAKRRGHSTEDAEDFAQYCNLKYITERKASIGTLFIDWLRLQYGKVGTPDNAMRVNEARYYTAVEDTSLGIEDAEHISNFTSMVSTLVGDQRAIAIMYFEWEFTLEELAHFYGVNESAMCQRINTIKEKLKNAIR